MVGSLAASFEEWAAAHGKTYSGSERLRRMAIYNVNAGIVRAHNKFSSFKLSLEGPFADMTNAEYRARLNPLLATGEAPAATEEEPRTVRLAGVDWRSSMPAVRDQAQCGSCWAFSAVGTLEGRYIIEHSASTSLDLSEQQMVDCSDSAGNQGCNGGWHDNTLNYIKTSGGVMKETDYPYVAKDQACKEDKSKNYIGLSTVKVPTAKSESSLASALESGPVAIAIDASHISFQLYTSGIYNEPKCSSTRLDHAVIAVGYGSGSDGDYWIVRNSWGPSWGIQGYIYMAKGSNQCGVATRTAYPTNTKLV